MHNSTAKSANFLLAGNDPLRLNKLHEYDILDTHPEDTFDKIAILASQVFNAPNAFITFVDKDRVFFKSNINNFVADNTPLAKNPFALASIKDDFTVYYDTFDDHFLRDSPLVHCVGGIRFYAAAPLITPEGFIVGTVCVADSIPRSSAITTQQAEMLKSLADIIINKLESRLRYNNLLKVQEELMNITLHEIKNPLATISLASDVLRKDSFKAEKMAVMIKQGVNRINVKLDEILKHSAMKEAELNLDIEEIDLNELFDSLLKNFELIAERKNQKIIIERKYALPKVPADKKKICDVFHNLLSNALKYSHENTCVTIKSKVVYECVQIEFCDQGQGMDENDLNKLYMRFTKLSAKPTGKETATGLGLFISKSLVEMHNGNISARSEGKDCGSTFTVTLPLTHVKKAEPRIE